MARGDTMEAIARMHFDRNYFECSYADWLANRARWRPYALLFALGAIVVGVAFVYCSPSPGVGVIAVGAGLYHAYEALTHRSRWIKDRLNGLPPDKVVTISFHTESMNTETPNSSATLRYDAIARVVGTPNGIFILPQTGVSIYVPRACVEPTDAFTPLLEHLDRVINHRPNRDH